MPTLFRSVAVLALVLGVGLPRVEKDIHSIPLSRPLAMWLNLGLSIS